MYIRSMEKDYQISHYKKGRKEEGRGERKGNTSKNHGEKSFEIYQISEPDEWYNVSYEQIQNYRGTRILDAHGGIANALKQIYPDHCWDVNK